MNRETTDSDHKSADIIDGTPELPASEPVAGSPKKKYLLYGISAALLLALIFTGVSAVNRRQTQSEAPVDISQQTVPTPADHRWTTLTVDAAAASVSSTMVTVPIRIDTGDNTVSAVELHVAVDPSTVKGLKVIAGSFFVKPTVLESKSGEAPGTYVFTIGSLAPRQGAGDIALVSWAKTAGSTATVTVRLDPQTKAAAIGESDTVVKQVTDGIVRY